MVEWAVMTSCCHTVAFATLPSGTDNGEFEVKEHGMEKFLKN